MVVPEFNFACLLKQSWCRALKRPQFKHSLDIMLILILWACIIIEISNGLFSCKTENGGIGFVKNSYLN